MSLEYLFDPKAVAGILKHYLSLRQRLPNPTDEGQEATYFKARKTERQIYRVLANQHYSHLVQLLETLEYCLANGYEQPKLLKTRVRQDYGSALAELFVAEFFIRHGFKVRSLEEGKGSTTVPEMVVELGALSLSVEAYSPRDWGGLDDFQDELRLGIRYLDIPWDFRFKIRTELLEKFDSNGKLLHFDPWQFSDAFENPRQRLARIVPILSEIQTSLTGSRESRTIWRADEDHNILTEIRIEEIQESQHHLPCREGFELPISQGGYAPEGMFDQVIERRVLRKIKKGQAQSLPGNHVSALFVDLSRLGYSSEFEHSWYLRRFQQSVEKHLDPDVVNIDWVVFFSPGPKAGLPIGFPLVFRRASEPHDLLDELFGCA